MEIKPFTVSLRPAVMDDLRERLENARWPDEVAGAGWDYGCAGYSPHPREFGLQIGSVTLTSQRVTRHCAGYTFHPCELQARVGHDTLFGYHKIHDHPEPERLC